MDEPELQARLQEVFDVKLADDELAWELGPRACGSAATPPTPRSPTTPTSACRTWPSPARRTTPADMIHCILALSALPGTPPSRRNAQKITRPSSQSMSQAAHRVAARVIAFDSSSAYPGRHADCRRDRQRGSRPASSREDGSRRSVARRGGGRRSKVDAAVAARSSTCATRHSSGRPPRCGASSSGSPTSSRLQRERAEQQGGSMLAPPRRPRPARELADTTHLREALASPKARGQWGERMADDVLRAAGFVEGMSYRKQTATRAAHPRLHVPAAGRPGAAHGREVPGRQLPPLPRGRRPTASATVPGRSSSATCGPG